MDQKHLLFKDDDQEARRRWDAFWAGDLIDRPIVCVTAPKLPAPNVEPYPDNYYTRIYDDLEKLAAGVLNNHARFYYGGEAIPSAFMSFGCDEIAAFCGGELRFHPDSVETNWSVPFVSQWENELPLKIEANNPLWQRMLRYCQIMAKTCKGKIELNPIDLHTNMDLLLAVRGGQELCIDLVDRPEMIDRAMDSARQIFAQVWRETRLAAELPMQSGATLQCDFSCMISTEMFRRWALPALEEEAEMVGHVKYHWDGPGALTHTDDLIRSKGLYLLSYVVGAGNGSHADFVELFQKIQSGGKAVEVHGDIDMIKWMHPQLDPRLVTYNTWAPDQQACDELLRWFVQHT